MDKKVSKKSEIFSKGAMSPRKIVVLCALAMEGDALKAAMGEVLRGAWPNDDVCKIVRCGVGRDKSQRRAREIITQERPELIINFGFAGSLVNDSVSWKIGDMAVAEIVCHDGGGQALGPCLPDDGLLKLARECGFRPARLATAIAPVQEAREAQRIRSELGVELVDMEAFFIAGLASIHSIKFLCLKVVSDLANESTPADFKKNAARVMAPAARQTAEVISRLIQQNSTVLTE